MPVYRKCYWSSGWKYDSDIHIFTFYYIITDVHCPVCSLGLSYIQHKNYSFY